MHLFNWTYIIFRGIPKKRENKAAKSNTETSIVVVTPVPGMVFPHNQAVQDVVHKKRKIQSPSSSGVKKRKGSATNATSTSISTPNPQSSTYYTQYVHLLSILCNATYPNRALFVFVTRSGTRSNDVAHVPIQVMYLASFHEENWGSAGTAETVTENYERVAYQEEAANQEEAYTKKGRDW